MDGTGDDVWRKVEVDGNVEVDGIGQNDVEVDGIGDDVWR